MQATQGGVNSAARSYTITVTAPVTITTASPLPGAGVSAAYSQQLASTGGSNTGYTYSISSGTLPAGITLSSGGLLSGTPAAAGTSTFSITVTDSAGATGSKAFSLTVAATTLMVTTTSLPAGRTNVAYSQQLTYSGGTGGTPTFALASGTLPGGLALGTAGLVSGSPHRRGDLYVLGHGDGGDDDLGGPDAEYCGDPIFRSPRARRHTAKWGSRSRSRRR